MKENEQNEKDPACCGSSKNLSKETCAIHVPYRKRDAYGALSVPVYNAVAYEFDNAQDMTDAQGASTILSADWSRKYYQRSQAISTER